MYAGRIVGVGRNPDGRNAVLYRVSSRSFPNRVVKVVGGQGVVVPKEGCETDIDKNPYIAYRCLRVAGEVAVATNGSQTDPIAEKIEQGMSIRDAMASVLLALDFEKDAYDTPRIAAAVSVDGDTGWLGVVRKSGLEVRELPLQTGHAYYLATYEIDTIDPKRTSAFVADDAKVGAHFAVEGGAFGSLTNAVTAICAMAVQGGFELGCYTVS